MYVPTPPPQPLSPRARELGQQLAEVLDEFERQYPGMSAGEIRQALKFAAGMSRRGEQSTGPVIGVAVGLAVLALFGWFFFARSEGGTMDQPWILGAVTVGIVVVGLMFVLRNRSL